MIRGIVAALALAAQAPAQELRWSQSSSGPNPGAYGSWVAIAGDVDADGFDDVLVGDPSGGSFQDGRVEVLSGLDGSVIHSYGGALLDGLGVEVDGAGDIDGDGHADFVVAAIEAPAVVYSGIDGSPLYTMDASLAGVSVAGAGDVNADGYPDVIIGKYSPTIPQGRAWVYSGAFMADGIPPSTLHTFDGQPSGAQMKVTGAGDVNGDGRADLAVGKADESGMVGPNPYRGIVRVYSGLDGALIRTHYHFGSDFNGFGASLAGVGDLDGDGRGELIVGAWADDTGGSNAGAAYVFRGASGQALYSFIGGSANAQLGFGVDGAGDVNGDHVPDLLLGGATGRVRLHSGLNGMLLAEIGPLPGLFGRSVAGGGDIDGDGFADFAAGAPSAGLVYAYGGICTGASYGYCTAAPNSHAPNGGAILATGSTSIGAEDSTLIATSCPPGQSGLFFYGTQQQAIPYGDGTLCVGGAIFRIFPVVTMNAAGTASLLLDFDVPPLGGGPGAIEPGDTRYFSFWFRDPAGGPVGFNYTNGQVLTFCP